MSRGKHSSVEKDLRLIVAWLDSLPLTKKVMLGVYCCRHSMPVGTIKVRSRDGCALRLRCYTGGGIRDLVLISETESGSTLAEQAVLERYS